MKQAPAVGGLGGKSVPWIPLVLLLLAVADLRVEILLLADHFTFTSLAAALRSHPLAGSVLLLQPSLWKHYRRRAP